MSVLGFMYAHTQHKEGKTKAMRARGQNLTLNGLNDDDSLEARLGL